MIARDPDRRFPVPGEAAEALGPFAAGADLAALLSTAGEPAGPPERSRGESRDRRRMHGLLAAAVLTAVGILFLIVGWKTLRPGERPATAPRVTSLQVDRFSNRSGKAEPLGRIGAQSFGAEVDDDVQVTIGMSVPGYCYLLALNPDGKVQLCWPEDDQRAPEKTESIRFPVVTTLGFGLTDGEGLQGFLVAASLEPLPPFARWREQVHLPWAKTRAEGVWRFDGAGIEPEGDPGRGTRGQVRSLRGLEPFARVCEELRARPEFSSVLAIAFPVEMRR
jgi:hypothetical protein